MNWDEANDQMLACSCGTDSKPVCFTHEGDYIPELNTTVIVSASCPHCGSGSNHPNLEGLVEQWNSRIQLVEVDRESLNTDMVEMAPGLSFIQRCRPDNITWEIRNRIQIPGRLFETRIIYLTRLQAKNLLDQLGYEIKDDPKTSGRIEIVSQPERNKA